VKREGRTLTVVTEQDCAATESTTFDEIELVAKHLRPQLVAAARSRFYLCEDDAQELAQSVITKWVVYANRQGAGERKPRREGLARMLFRMLSQCAIDLARLASAKNVPISDDLESTRSADDMLVLFQRKEIIRELFSGLPTSRREALFAIYVTGLTQDEAAEQLGMDRRLISDWKRSFEAAAAKRATEIGLDE